MSGTRASGGVAVVICTRNRPQFLSGALAAACTGLGPNDAVLVVDSASDTTEPSQIATDAGCRVVRVDQPGLSRARNAGIIATDQPIIAFTDDDCLPEAGWLEAISAAFDDPHVGVVFGRVTAEHPRGPVPSHDPGKQPLHYDTTADPARLGAGACMAFRREAIEAIEGFDESLGAGAPLRSGEDHDAAWRVLRAGWTGRYEPEARVVHREWRSDWQLVRMGWAYGLGAGAVAAKIATVDRAAGWRLMGRRLGPDGLGMVARNLARRWERAALTSLLYTAGVAVGALRIRTKGTGRPTRAHAPKAGR